MDADKKQRALIVAPLKKQPASRKTEIRRHLASSFGALLSSRNATIREQAMSALYRAGADVAPALERINDVSWALYSNLRMDPTKRYELKLARGADKLQMSFQTASENYACEIDDHLALLAVIGVLEPVGPLVMVDLRDRFSHPKIFWTDHGGLDERPRSRSAADFFGSLRVRAG